MRLPPYPVRGQPFTVAHGRCLTDAMRELRDRPAGRSPERRRDPADFPWDQLANGYTITSATQITLVNIRLHWGAHAAYTLGDTAVTISATYPNVHYVGLAFDGTTLSVPSASTSRDSFLPDATTYRTWLFGFVLVGSGPQRVAVGRMGTVELDASWGPPA